MKVGLFINTQFPEGFNLAERVPEMVAQVRAARDAGFASLWFPHHWLTHPMQMLQITPVMGYVAAHTCGPIASTGRSKTFSNSRTTWRLASRASLSRRYTLPMNSSQRAHAPAHSR
jgi:hypothetical protein